MRPKTMFLLAGLLAAALYGLAAVGQGAPKASADDKSPRDTPKPPGAADPEAAALGETTFALDLYGRLAAKAPVGDNLGLSPFGAASALGLAAAGARGETAAGAAKALHLTPPERIPAALGALRLALEAAAAHRSLSARLGLRVADAKVEGVRVAEVVPGSPAARAALQAGDVVIDVDGQAVAGPADFANFVDLAADRIVLHARREGQDKPLTFKLALGGDYSDDAVQLRIGTSLWGQQDGGFRASFLDVARDDFGAAVHEVDFAGAPDAACKAVNDWAAQQTNDKIKDLLSKDAVSPQTQLILVNAVYFKASWAAPFDVKATKSADFFPSPDQKVPVDLMDQTGKFRTALDKGVQVLELPYRGGKFAMTLLLPEKKDGLAELEKNLTPENLAQWDKQLDAVTLRVLLPRFRTSSRLELKSSLSDMGMAEAFGPSADFGAMSPKKGLVLSSVVHQTVVSADESGTEAAAATAVLVERGHTDHVFRADHPFVFLIRDARTHTVLFLGRVVNPQPKG
jgi:serine protease inhibitor